MTLVIPNTFVPNTVADANAVNDNFAYVLQAIEDGATTPATLFNAATYGYSPTETGVNNVAFLQAAVNDAIASNGGQVFIPTGSYQHAGTVNIVGTSAPGGNFGGLIIQGSSAGVQIFQNSNTDTFDVSNAGQVGTNNGGIRFRDLQITYNHGLTSGIAINADNAGSVTTAFYCTFTNCPQTFVVGLTAKALFCGLAYCTIDQNVHDNSVQIFFGASQGFLLQNIIRQQSQGSGGGPTGCTGIVIQQCDEVYITNCHISDFDTGVSILQGTNNIYILGCAIQSWVNSIIVRPPTNIGTINDVWITNTYCARTNNSTAPASAGIIIDGNTGAVVTNVQGVYITGTQCVGFNDSGLQIGVASNVIVTGGMYASNGQNPSDVALGAGIVVHDAADSVSVTGADLIGTYVFTGGVQPYAAALSGGCSNIEFYNCDMLGNANVLPVYTGGTITHWFVLNCRGYNTFNYQVSTTAPTTGTQFDGTGHGTPITQWAVPYLGPILVTWVGATVTNLKTSHDRSALSATDSGPIQSGTISLRPPQSMQLNYSGSFTNFVILGQ
jgi:hypothetical protein